MLQLIVIKERFLEQVPIKALEERCISYNYFEYVSKLYTYIIYSIELN